MRSALLPAKVRNIFSVHKGSQPLCSKNHPEKAQHLAAFTEGKRLFPAALYWPPWHTISLSACVGTSTIGHKHLENWVPTRGSSNFRALDIYLACVCMCIGKTYSFSELFIDKQVIKIFILTISKGGKKKSTTLFFHQQSCCPTS